MKKQTPEEIEANRKRLAIRSWALAEMYLQPLFPPPEVQAEQERRYHETQALINNMQAGGVAYDVASTHRHRPPTLPTRDYMSHTAKPWQPGDGTNPYGRPGKTGNGHEAWRRFSTTPCPVCGSHAKRMKIEGDKLTIICGKGE